MAKRYNGRKRRETRFYFWNLSPSQALYLKYISNVPYSHKHEFSIIKGEEIRVIKAKNWKVYLYALKMSGGICQM